MIIREVLFSLTFCETAKQAIEVRAGSPLFLWGGGDWGVMSASCSIRSAYRLSLVDLRFREDEWVYAHSQGRRHVRYIAVELVDAAAIVGRPWPLGARR